MSAYVESKFVNRTNEIGLVFEKVKAMLAGGYIAQRTIIFTGEHGMGKTWLLSHIAQKLKTWEQVHVVHASLADYDEEQSPDKTIYEILEDFSRHLLNQSIPPHLTSDQIAHFLIQEIKKLLGSDQLLVVVMDAVYESVPIFLNLLETLLLGPLSVQPNVLIVMAGRGREYTWTTPELRLRAEFVTLPPFTAQATTEQLERQAPDAVIRTDNIYHLALGNPKATYLLAGHEKQTVVLNQIVCDMLLPVPGSQRRLTRDHLEALSVPRLFDRSHIPILLSAYYEECRYKTLSRAKIREVLDLLIEPGLAYWNSDQSAYTLYESTRNLTLSYLRYTDHIRLIALHEAMFALYISWTQGKPSNWETWQQEADYHQKRIEIIKKFYDL